MGPFVHCQRVLPEKRWDQISSQLLLPAMPPLPLDLYGRSGTRPQLLLALCQQCQVSPLCGQEGFATSVEKLGLV